jgi:hypothetical protein
MAAHTKTTTRTGVLKMLTAQEEKALRMKRGAALDPDDELDTKTNDPRLAAQIADIENAVFAKLRAMAVPGRAESAVKNKIVASLKSKK